MLLSYHFQLYLEDSQQYPFVTHSQFHHEGVLQVPWRVSLEVDCIGLNEEIDIFQGVNHKILVQNVQELAGFKTLVQEFSYSVVLMIGKEVIVDLNDYLAVFKGGKLFFLADY